VNPHTFLDIENAITRRLWAAWRPMAAALYAKVAEAVDAGQYGKAYDIAKSLDLTPIGDENKQWIKYHLLSAAIFGAANANAQNDKVNIVSLGQHETILDRVADTFLAAIEYNATTQVYGQLVQLIASHERESHAESKVMKADDDKSFLHQYTDFRESGDAALQLQSSLHTARLAVWGFTAEADVRGVSTYRLQAVLDGRTSKYCEYIDGKEFQVADARKRITDALSATDPNDLKTIQPWPNQSKAGLADLKEYSNDELAQLGYAVPPFHPGCRTLCVLVNQEIVEGAVSTSPAQQRDDLGDLPPSDSTTDTFSELGLDFDEDDVDQWNNTMGVSPVSALATLTGDLPADVLADFSGSNAISVLDSGDISFKVSGDFAGADSDTAINVLYDPNRNVMDLNYLEMQGLSPETAANFALQTYKNMLNIGVSVGATELALTATTTDSILAHAALGFVPESAAEWYSLKTSILADLDSGLAHLKTDLSPAQWQALNDILSSQDPNAFLALTSLPYTVAGQSIANLLLQGRSLDLSLDVADDYQSEQFFG
jgi:hypothetical protein